MRKIVLFVIIGFILMGLISTASAWEGERKGLTLGFGVGTGVTAFTYRVENTCYVGM